MCARVRMYMESMFQYGFADLWPIACEFVHGHTGQRTRVVNEDIAPNKRRVSSAVMDNAIGHKDLTDTL